MSPSFFIFSHGKILRFLRSTTSNAIDPLNTAQVNLAEFLFKEGAYKRKREFLGADNYVKKQLMQIIKDNEW